MSRLAVAVLVTSFASPAFADAPIVGGTMDSNDPAVVLLAAYPANMSTLFTCSAVVVSPGHLLTAAHCLDHAGYTFGVYYGADASAYSTLAELAPQLSPITAVHMYPGYQTASPFEGDIGVVDLATPTAVTPLLFERSAPTADLVNMPARIVGYGQTVYNTPNQVRYSATTIVASLDSGDTLLIGDATHRTCVGDSGGPAIYGGVVLGIDSYSDTTGCTDPSHFRRTDVYAAFIDTFAGTGVVADDLPVDMPTDAGTVTKPGSSSGCSTTNGGGAGLVVVGLAAVIARRRRASR